jgi:hypothetical protein
MTISFSRTSTLYELHPEAWYFVPDGSHRRFNHGHVLFVIT